MATRDLDENDQTRWSGDMPLPDWWDDSADAAAQCEAAVLDRHGLHQVCTRPDGHAGRHLTAFAVFAGHPAVIACAWPGAHEPVASDLDEVASDDLDDPSDPDYDEEWRTFRLGWFRLGVLTGRGVCPDTGETSGVYYVTLAFSRNRRVE